MSDRLIIRVYEIDGAVETFTPEDPELVRRTLAALHPTGLYVNEKITAFDEHSNKTFATSRITRIDLMTDQLSVWDFPFSFGALSELTESEFDEGIRFAQDHNRRGSGNTTSLYLDLRMLDGVRSFLGMQIVAGMQPARLRKIYSLFKERRLIFGLRAGGVGVLNLANLVHFTVAPEPPDFPVHETTRKPTDRLVHLQSDTRTASRLVKQL